MFILLSAALALRCTSTDEDKISKREVECAAGLIDLQLTQSEIDTMLPDLMDQLSHYREMRKLSISNKIIPALIFDPVPRGLAVSPGGDFLKLSPTHHRDLPADLEELAFWTVRDLAELIRTRRITSTQLTEMYLERLKRHGPTLECVITLTEELALDQAARADDELASGRYRGYLHGIPYGAKDLLAVEGYRTTWGAEPYREQVIDETATVIRRLEEAGAVLLAKLTLGALAWGDVWYGGVTKNPWNLEQGSSGSSAGSAAATAAGLVAFSIGSETWGSIVSPCTRCGVTGLRPTFGRVSRHGAMALSWSMDKIGPICRSAEDCAIVFDVIRGSDGKDPTVVDAPFGYEFDEDITGMRIGYIPESFERDDTFRDTDSTALDLIRKMGIDLVPIELPDYPLYPLGVILSAEAAAAFDELTRSNRDDMMVRQIRSAWPNALRSARFIPAVEYIQANRIRSMIMRDMEKLDVDIYIAPSFGENLLLTNLTGHPCVVLPNGFDENGGPVSITFIGKPFGEGKLLAFAHAYQERTGFHRKHPPGFEGKQ
jgi:Asp-tRNA(Asn)/Glu-tRNA(Gln) amidotransferase A subunit family amidase